MSTPAEIATLFVEAFARRDVDAMAGHLADDVVFESPRGTIEGAAPVLAAMGQFAEVVAGVQILSVLGDGEQAMIMYDMVTGPFGTLRAADHLVIRDGRIVSDRLVFDTYELRKATP
ncbi:nuclear transport factor 2 family protein [Nonomuraea sp. NPDC050790]|uniref:nuclear transport factor 2 family protein n=1 Tax=Nonomuraea sp. NPDC050790 TaxID=3364371 RepID=UPI0037A37E41